MLNGSETLIIYDSTGLMRVVQLPTFKTKYSFMISLEEDEKIEVIDILDNKILAIATDRGEIYFKNLYSQEIF